MGSGERQCEGGGGSSGGSGCQAGRGTGRKRVGKSDTQLEKVVSSDSVTHIRKA